MMKEREITGINPMKEEKMKIVKNMTTKINNIFNQKDKAIRGEKVPPIKRENYSNFSNSTRLPKNLAALGNP